MTRPVFSVVIPTYGRPGQLGGCLTALSNLEYLRDRFEVIVVNDGGEDPLDADSTSGFPDLNLHVLRQDHAGPATARNHGAARAQGEYLAFTDDDCRPARDWLTALESPLSAGSTCAVVGRTVNGLPDNIYSAASQLLIDYLQGYYTDARARTRFVVSNNLAVPAQAFRDVGGFDPGFRTAGGEDREFGDRWIHAGHDVLYSADAMVVHLHALTARAFWRQHFRYGRGAFHFHRARARRGQGRVRFEPWRFYRALLMHPFNHGRKMRALAMVWLFVVSQAANASGLIWEQWRMRNSA